MTDREKILIALREKPLKIFEVMKRVNIKHQDDCQSLQLKMRDDGVVKFDIHKGHWLGRRCRPPRNHPTASAYLPSSTDRSREMPRRKCVRRSALPSCLAWPIGDSFYLALFTGQRQTDRLIMREESNVAGRHAFRQSKTGELVDIKEAPQLSARLKASRGRIKELKLRLQLENLPPEFVVNEDNGEPYDESTYRHWVSTARAVAVFGFLVRDTARQAIVRAERLMAELVRTVDVLFARFPLDEENKARRARAVSGPNSLAIASPTEHTEVNLTIRSPFWTT
jgi:hypothetical protein